MSDSFLTAIFIVLSGGFQDAYTYMCRGEVFANAQTGNIVLMAANLFQGELSKCLRYLVPIISFMVGTYVAEHIHFFYKYKEKIHWRQIIILFEVLLLFYVGFIPRQNLTGICLHPQWCRSRWHFLPETSQRTHRQNLLENRNCCRCRFQTLFRHFVIADIVMF